MLLNFHKEADPEVKKNAFEALTTIVHYNVELVRVYLADIQKFASQETVQRKELIETVDLGPFKH